jgi:hypothetical protein
MPAFFLFLSLVCATSVAAQTWQLDCVPAWTAAVPARCAALGGTLVETCCVYRLEGPRRPFRSVADMIEQWDRERGRITVWP